MIGRTLGCAVVCGWLMASGSLQAHHSLAGVYDMKSKDAEVTGTLTKILFVNPHGSLHMAVKNAEGGTTEWVFTTGSATTLAERGISKSAPMPSRPGKPFPRSSSPRGTAVRWGFSSRLPGRTAPSL